MSTYSTWEHPWAPLSPVVARVAEYWFDLPEGWKERANAAMPVGLLVGEQPGPSSNPRLPLWPYPTRSAGGRLHAMSGIDVGDYLLRLARVNLARRPVARWDPNGARQRALEIVRNLPAGARVVACGVRAQAAFGLAEHFTVTRAFLDDDPDVRLVSVPHPSGRCRDYNDPAACKAAGRVVRWAAGMDD